MQNWAGEGKRSVHCAAIHKLRRSSMQGTVREETWSRVLKPQQDKVVETEEFSPVKEGA